MVKPLRRGDAPQEAARFVWPLLADEHGGCAVDHLLRESHRTS